MSPGHACTALLLLLAAACSRQLPWAQSPTWNLPKEAETAYRQARDLYYRGKFAAAAELFDRVFQSSLAVKNPYAIALKYEGLCYQYRGYHDQALELFQRAAEYDRQATDELDSLNNLGWLAYLRGDLAESRNRLQEAEQLIMASGLDPRGSLAVTVHIDLGIVHEACGDYIKALEYYSLARDVLHVKPHPMNETLLFRHLGNLEHQWGSPELALVYYERALSAAARASDQPYNPAYYAEALIDCASFLMQSGNPRRDPEQVLRRALAESRKLDTPRLTARAFAALGDLARRRGNPRSALDYHRQALDQANRLSLKAALQPILVEIGFDQLALQDFRAAAEAFHRALAQISGVRPREVDIRICNRLTQCAAGIRDLDAALRHNREAIGLAESTNLRSLSELSRANFRSQQYGAYAALVDLLAGQGQFEAAWQAADRGRSLTLQEATGEHNLPAQPAPESRERYLLARISRLEAQLLAVPDQAREGGIVREIALSRAALEQLEANRRPRSAAAGSGPAAPPSLTAIRNRLRAPGELFVEFQLSEPRSHAWIISAKSCRYVALPGQSVVEDAVRRFLERVTAPPVGSDALTSWRERGHDLYRMLFGADAADVATASRLHIVPDGMLHALPFESLPVGKSAVGFDQTLAVREIAYVPSAMVWLQPRKTAATGKASEFLALGFMSTYPSGNSELGRMYWHRYQNIPGAEIEAREVGIFLGALPGRSLLGKDAAESFLLQADLSRCRILHIASHVYADENDPLRSGIFLSPGNGEDGYLCMDEISRIRLNADLVTLSGCRSGLGRILRAEGMFSLARAFLAAGARSVIMSLWKTDDEANLQFMKIFYRELSRGVRPSKALQEARRPFCSSDIPAYRHPYFWAPFVLTEMGFQ